MWIERATKNIAQALFDKCDNCDNCNNCYNCDKCDNHDDTTIIFVFIFNNKYQICPQCKILKMMT